MARHAECLDWTAQVCSIRISIRNCVAFSRLFVRCGYEAAKQKQGQQSVLALGHHVLRRSTDYTSLYSVLSLSVHVIDAVVINMICLLNSA